MPPPLTLLSRHFAPTPHHRYFAWVLQLARDARLGYFDAERVLFIKKVSSSFLMHALSAAVTKPAPSCQSKPTHLLRNVLLLPILFPFVFQFVAYIYPDHSTVSPTLFRTRWMCFLLRHRLCPSFCANR